MQTNAQVIAVPENLEVTDPKLPRGYSEAKEVIRYCRTCTKKPKCNLNYNLRLAIGEDYPYWAEEFVTFKTSFDGSWRTEERTTCISYENQQMKLQGIPQPFCDGIEKLVENIRLEKIERESTIEPKCL
jgi:hypothetical protein